MPSSGIHDRELERFRSILVVRPLLIIVVVTMDFMAQVQSHLMSHQYEGLLKKANLKGYGRAGVPR